jgi:son of sevenless-like protein
LAKILGEEAPVPPPVIEIPWYLNEDYNPTEIILDDKGNVKAGTLKALVSKLTSHGQTGRFRSF